MCTKLAKYFGMIFGAIAMILVFLGVIGYFVWMFNGSSFLNVANFWNYFYASVPVNLLAIFCTLFVIAGKE